MSAGPLDVARAAWGDPLPEWIETLALACAQTSQAQVAKQLDRSAALISQLLRNKYPGDVVGLRERVMGVFMDGRVACPSLGEIAAQVCQDHRARSGTMELGNPLRRRMFRACNACPRNPKTKEVRHD
jgi:hypothetical protein